LHELADQGAIPPAPLPVTNMRVWPATIPPLHPAGEELHHFFRLFGVVALVVGPKDLVIGGIDDYRLDGSRTDVRPTSRGAPGIRTDAGFITGGGAAILPAVAERRGRMLPGAICC
jgi:hypothetical protein